MDIYQLCKLNTAQTISDRLSSVGILNQQQLHLLSTVMNTLPAVAHWVHKYTPNTKYQMPDAEYKGTFLWLKLCCIVIFLSVTLQEMFVQLTTKWHLTSDKQLNWI